MGPRVVALSKAKVLFFLFTLTCPSSDLGWKVFRLVVQNWMKINILSGSMTSLPSLEALNFQFCVVLNYRYMDPIFFNLDCVTLKEC